MNKTLFCIVMIILSCSQKQSSSTDKEKSENTNESKPYFPVLDYLKSEIRNVDSLQINVLKCTMKENKTDSTYIEPKEFHQLANEFLHPDLNMENFVKGFTETSFFDRTTQSSTFTYSPKNSNLEIQRVDVVIKSAAGFDKVNSIYIEKFVNHPISQQIKKLYWRTGNHFLIITEPATGQNSDSVTQVKVIWNYW